jgi:hypothetical protein
MMIGKLIQSSSGEWLVEYTENKFPHYRYLFPVDLSQEVIEENVNHWDNMVLFSTRYYNYELYAVVHDRY